MKYGTGLSRQTSLLRQGGREATVPSRRRFPWLPLAAGAIALLVAWPMGSVFLSWREIPSTKHHWSHLVTHVLDQVIWNTFFLICGVSLLTCVLGVSLAWICVRTDFPGRRVFRRLLILPLGIPAYITAFVYVGLFEYGSPLESLLRGVWEGSGVPPEIRSLVGCVVVLSLGLFPYPYLLCLNAFESQGRQLLAAAQTLGASPRRIFWRVALPYAKPFLFGGMLLVSLEVINDFGAVSIMGVDTLSTMVYKMWFGFFSPAGAAQFASVLLIFMLVLFSVMQTLKGQGTYDATHLNLEDRGHFGGGFRRWDRRARIMGWLRSFYCSVVILLAFGIPLFELALWTFATGTQTRHSVQDILLDLIDPVKNTFFLGVFVAFISTTLAMVLLWAKRTHATRGSARQRLFLKWTELIALTGYGIPGTVLAISIYLPMMQLDQKISRLLEALGMSPPGLILGGSLATMVVALTIRMLAVGHASLAGGLSRISPRLDDAASTLGVVGLTQVRRIQAPLLRAAWLHGMILVFVDTVKEVPLTLMTRPLGSDFLSVRIFAFVSEGEWEKAAIPALGLVAVTLVPFIFYSYPSTSLRRKTWPSRLHGENLVGFFQRFRSNNALTATKPVRPRSGDKDPWE